LSPLSPTCIGMCMSSTPAVFHGSHGTDRIRECR
jgi:hypothetical protein